MKMPIHIYANCVRKMPQKLYFSDPTKVGSFRKKIHFIVVVVVFVVNIILIDGVFAVIATIITVIPRYMDSE